MSAHAARPAQARQAGLAQIHIAKKQLLQMGVMDEDGYRAMLFAQARVKSSAELDHAGRAKVLAHMEACGAQLGRATWPANKTAGKPRKPAPDRQAQLSKIEALLADAGRPWAYVDGMCKRMFKIDRVQFATPDHLQRLIAALTYDQQRRAKQAAATEEAAAP